MNMNALSVVILIFSVAAAVDYVMGNKLGIGKEYEKGFMLLGTMALSMIGMISIAPLLGRYLSPALGFLSDTFHIDPSVIPASLFANDMGGAQLSVEFARDGALGLFNGLVVSSMMGCTISFTIPFALGLVKKEDRRFMIFGLLCGIVTIPFGCFVGGLVCKLSMLSLLIDLLPLVIFSGIIALGLVLFPDACLKIFNVFGFIIKAVIILGLTLGIINCLAKKDVIPYIAPIEEGALVCLNASVVMTGMFPLISIISRLLSKPLRALGRKIGINECSIVAIVSSLATSAGAFGTMDKMDDKGKMLNSAFAVSGAFTFASHLAFTMAYDASYIPAVIAGKLVAGALSLVVGYFLYGKFAGSGAKAETNVNTEGDEAADEEKVLEEAK